MQTVIISGGYIDDAFATEWIKTHAYDQVIAADKGMDFLYRNHLTPDLIVGDFDSVSTESLAYFKMNKVRVVELNPMKDDTDTEFAIRKAISEGASSITLLGATGTRLDHVMGNVHLLGIGLCEGVDMEIVDAYNRIRMTDKAVEFTKENQFGKYVSLLPFSEEVTGVTLEGFKYPLLDDTLKRFCTLGVSNEIVEENAKVQLEEGILVVIESRDEG